MSSTPAVLPTINVGRIARLAAEFWQDAGGAVFPRDPEPLIPLLYQVAVLPIPGLTCQSVRRWATAHGLPVPAELDDRPLHGCLLAHREHGYLFLDEGDPPDERRMTVAHELGHYVIEVWEPRRVLERAAGIEAVAVLDGTRPPTVTERLAAVLGGASLTPYVHLMTREDDGRIGCARIAGAEHAADTFALELLAPRSALRAEVVAMSGQPLLQRRAKVTALLRERFGLPVLTASAYAKDLVRELTGGETLREWLAPQSGIVLDD
jgi:hypothetical protein